MFSDLCKVLLDVEGFGILNGKRPVRKWGPKFLARVDSGRFRLLRPVLRRQEETMDIPPATVLTGLQVVGLKLVKSTNLPARRAAVGISARAKSQGPVIRRLLLADSAEDDDLAEYYDDRENRRSLVSPPRKAVAVPKGMRIPFVAVTLEKKKKPRTSFLPPIAQLGL